MSAILKQKLIDIANGFTKYGLWKGGGSGGSSALSDMTDVTFTNLQTNDVLTYNGSVWVNDDNLQTQINTLNKNLTYYDALYQSETNISIGTNIPLLKNAYDYKKLLIIIKLSGIENRSFEIIPGVDRNSFTEVAYANNQWYLNNVSAQIINDGNTLRINAVYAMNWGNPTLLVIYGQKYL